MAYQIIRRIQNGNSEFIEAVPAEDFDLQDYIKKLPKRMQDDEYKVTIAEFGHIVAVGNDLDDAGYQVDATIRVNGEEISDTFYVQLTGGEYLSQMGCWICGNYDGDINFHEYKDGIFQPFVDKIISAAEKGYAKDIELDQEGWEHVRSIHYSQTSATSSSRITIEKNEGRIEDGEEDAYRAYIDNSGFTQPNDYSAMPDFKVEYFDSEPPDELIDELIVNNNNSVGPR